MPADPRRPAPPTPGGDQKINATTLSAVVAVAIGVIVGLVIGKTTSASTRTSMLVGAGIAFFTGRPIAGWLIGSVMQAQVSLIFGFLGLMGDHVRQISERTRAAPLVHERERYNFPQDY